MTAKDYKLLAQAIGVAIIDARQYSEHIGGVQLVISRLITVLAADNPRFNREIFLKAIDDCSKGVSCK